MLRKIILLSLIGLLMAGLTPAQTLQEILESYYEARGGLDKLKAIGTLRMTGKMVMGQGMEAPITIEQMRPEMSRTDFIFQGMTGTQAYDGETAWMLMPFMGKDEPEEMTGDQTKMIKDNADFDGVLVNWKEKGHQLELMGQEEVEGTETFKIKVIRKNGDIDYQFLDSEYFIPIKMSGKRKMDEQEVEFEVYLGDYKEVEGVMFPFSIETRAPGGGASQTLTIETIELNVDIDVSRFMMPGKGKQEDEAGEGSGTGMEGKSEPETNAGTEGKPEKAEPDTDNEKIEGEVEQP